MKKYFTLFFLGLVVNASLAQKIRISGQVRDAESGELLAGVSVWDSLSGTGSYTNTYGFFSMEVSSPKLRFTYVGYKTFWLTAQKHTVNVNVKLERAGLLEEVVVASARNKTLSGNPLSLAMSEIKNMPSLLGEADVLKVFSFTPGVATGNEGSAGLYVRGGTPDQNLILLDEVPVYNAMHLGGFFSVFNPASLKKADLYKGAFPARFGGRLSSVIDLTMKEGNNQKFGGELGLGLLNQSLTLEGPIVKNKASFIVSGRISTLGLSTFLSKKRRQGTSGEDYVYKFHDLNAKLNYQISKKDHLYLSFYNGFDRFKYEEWSAGSSNEVATRVGNNWGNSTGTLRYSRTLSPKLFGRAVLIYSDYTSQFTNAFEDNSQIIFRNSDTRVTDVGGKMQLDYYPNKFLEVRAGFDVVYHRFKPFHLNTNYDNIGINSKDQYNVSGLQKDVFLDTDIKPFSNLVINAGLRLTDYTVVGKSFVNAEPRLAFNYDLPHRWKLNASATVMNQYLHLLVNNGYGFGFDAWLPATDKVPPAKAKQWSVGIAKELPSWDVYLSAEYYQKRVQNAIDYPEGTNFSGMLADSWEDIVVSGGQGRVNGFEFMASRNKGKLRGRLSYTLSKSELRFDGINDGDWYPMKYDRRNNLNFSLAFHFNTKWSINSTFIYQTGHAVTLPVSAVLYNDRSKFIYSDRNGSRMPDFHKLDIGASRKGTLWNKYKTQLSFGLYNAYNRANPLYLDFSTNYNRETGQRTLVLKQYPLFPVLPFINYSIKF